MNYTLSQIVPATKFVRGFSKYTSQLKKQGHFLILKDNEPLAVMIEPAKLEYYESLLERLEDMEDAIVVAERLKTPIAEYITTDQLPWKS